MISPSLAGGHLPKPDPTYFHKRRRRRPVSSPHSHSPRVSPLLFLFFFAISCLTLTTCAPNCLRFANYASINQLFIDGGPGTKVLLCPSKTYRVLGTIVFTAADQELATYGYPTGSERAVLQVAGDVATAIQGDCRRCARVAMRNLVIDGNREKFGRIVDSDAATGLIVLGGNEGQTVAECWIKDPRGFTAIHIREGDKMSCTGAVIEKNEIGPVGNEFDPEVDGPDPEMSPLGRPLADGISIACRDSFVLENTFYDNTDAAIVVYCSPGTLIHANRISTNRMSAMAGILLVDSTPFDGDYTGTTIKGNIIDAASRIIRVGIGLGAAVWSDDIDTILWGGSVLANGIKGKHMGYGIAAAGLKGWTIKDNWDEAVHRGKRSARCFDSPVNPDPLAFLQWSETIKSTSIQPDFVDQEFQYVVCIDGVEDTDVLPKHDSTPPRPHKDSMGAADPPAAIEAKPHIKEGFSTGSDVMDDILEHSQQRMLEAIEHLSRRVDVLAVSARDSVPLQRSIGSSTLSPNIAAGLNGLATRVQALETRQRSLVDTALSMRRAMKAWDEQIASMNEWQYDALLDVQHRLGFHLAPALDSPAGSGQSQGRLESLSNRARLLGVASPRADTGWWASLLRFLVTQGLFAAVIVGARRWLKKRRDHSKIL